MHPTQLNVERGFAPRFPDTEWTQVVEAGQQAGSALARLCTLYRAPLLAYLQGQGHGPADAEDLVQGFLQHLCTPGTLGGVARDKGGRFRTWLLTTLKNRAVDAGRRERAQKRGGGVPPATLDTVTGEHAPGLAVAHVAARPDEAYDRKWATTLLGHALNRMKEEFARQGKAHWFELIEPVLYGDAGAASFREIALATDLTEGSARSAVSRVRIRLRALIREEVARTVSDPALIEEELQHLVRLLGR